MGRPHLKNFVARLALSICDNIRTIIILPSRRIDFVLTTPRLASLAVNKVYEPFFYCASGDDQGFCIDFNTSPCSPLLSQNVAPPPEDSPARTKNLSPLTCQNLKITLNPTISNGLTTSSRQGRQIMNSSKPLIVRLLRQAYMLRTNVANASRHIGLRNFTN